MTPDDQRAAVECMALAITRTATGFQDATVTVKPAMRFAAAALRALLDAGWSVSRKQEPPK